MRNKQKLALRLALLSLALVCVLCSVVSTLYAKYSSYIDDPFELHITAGTINLDISGGEIGVIVTPGTYISATYQTQVKLGKNSEDCFVFVKVDKSDNVKDIMEVNVHSSWTQLDGQSGVYYQELSKTTINTHAESVGKDHASYIVFSNKAKAIWVSPSATKAQIEAITSDDKITFTAYAVQKTPGIMDAATAWEALPESQSS